MLYRYHLCPKREAQMHPPSQPRGKSRRRCGKSRGKALRIPFLGISFLIIRVFQERFPEKNKKRLALKEKIGYNEEKKENEVARYAALGSWAFSR